MDGGCEDSVYYSSDNVDIIIVVIILDVNS